MTSDAELLDIAKKIGDVLVSKLSKNWDGKECVLYMKDNGCKHWRQMEWAGFYFEFLCKQALKDIMEEKIVRYGLVEFDGFKKIPWDYKAHSSNLAKDVPTNGLTEIRRAIAEFGSVGLIIAQGDVILESEYQSFKKWHDSLKGKKSRYVQEGIENGRPSRLRKEIFKLKKITFLRINEESLARHREFQKGMVNSNGNPRNSKLLVDMNKIEHDIIYEVNL